MPEQESNDGEKQVQVTTERGQLNSELQCPDLENPMNNLDNYKFDALQPVNFIAYGVGHFLNDLTASFWFNFSLYFLVTVAQTQAAAFTFLMGQVVDSICTPLVGYYSDRIRTKFGQRTPWYCAGYVIVMLCFPFIFRSVHLSYTAEMIYYPVFAGLFNVGWAFCQISHMSLVPSISCSKSRREKLNNFRNTATFVANFILLSLVTVFLSFQGDHETYFFVISLILIAIGSITTMFFLYHTREPMLVRVCNEQRRQLQLVTNTCPDDSDVENIDFKWYYWFKKSAFYFYGLAYVTARLSVNVMITILPFYVKKLSHSTEHDITIALLLLYLSSIITSANTKHILRLVGAKWILALGFMLSIFASLILLQAFQSTFETQFIFLATFVIGIGQAIVLNSVLNFICDIIGSIGHKGGFVFGSYSFMDKISTGIVVYLISNGAHLSNSVFIRYLILILPPLLSLVSCLMVCFAVPKRKTAEEQNLAPKTLLEQELI